MIRRHFLAIQNAIYSGFYFHVYFEGGNTTPLLTRRLESGFNIDLEIGIEMGFSWYFQYINEVFFPVWLVNWIDSSLMRFLVQGDGDDISVCGSNNPLRDIFLLKSNIALPSRSSITSQINWNWRSSMVTPIIDIYCISSLKKGEKKGKKT